MHGTILGSPYHVTITVRLARRITAHWAGFGLFLVGSKGVPGAAAPANGGKLGVMGAAPLGVVLAGVSAPLPPKLMKQFDTTSLMVARSCLVVGCIALASS